MGYLGLVSVPAADDARGDGDGGDDCEGDDGVARDGLMLYVDCRRCGDVGFVPTQTMNCRESGYWRPCSKEGASPAWACKG